MSNWPENLVKNGKNSCFSFNVFVKKILQKFTVNVRHRVIFSKYRPNESRNQNFSKKHDFLRNFSL